MVALTLALLVLSFPATAQAAGCEVMQDLRDRSECQARAEAREAARGEVARQLAGGASATTSEDTPVSGGDPSRSADWRAAMDEADEFDASVLLEARPLAAVGGLVWFFLVVRSRRRARVRTSRA